ncbi:MAG: homoserine dehydrogenase [Pseudomonadota bacterium]
MQDPLKIGIAGLGTVGVGVIKILEQTAERIAARAGRPIAITHVSARTRGKDRGVDIGGYTWCDDPGALADAPVDVIVELMGGSDGPALVLAQKSLSAGKHFVTANKALIAHHGQALAESAERSKAVLRFEAAVAGGIPVIKALCDGLAANEIVSVQGILNGTCNYILSVMDQEGADFGDVLADAQRLGYAEADPTFDIDGIDAAHKLAILAAISFGAQVDFDSVSVDGIRAVSPVDLDYARQLGYRLKLIGRAHMVDGMLEQRVAPTLVPVGHPLAAVEDSFNAIVFEGLPVGQTVFEGRGAGEGPTASAVVADIIDIARGGDAPAFGVLAAALKKLSATPTEARQGRFYVRLTVEDEVGVAASIASLMRDHGISMDSLLQRGEAGKGEVTFVLTTHRCALSVIEAAAEALAALEVVLSKPAILRIQDQDDV